MATSDSEATSPDPLTLPSSPLLIPRASRSPTRKSPSRRAPIKEPTFSSPAKSIFLETGRPGQVSPWRIKVTVQAEPNDRAVTGSPSQQKLARTTKVPLKTNSSSPAKKPRRQPTPRAPSTVMDIQKPSRKRKGTPLRGQPSAKKPSPDPTTDEDRDDFAVIPTTEPAVPVLKPPTRPRQPRRSLEKMPTPPSKKLGYARDQLDHALQEAVGYDGNNSEDTITVAPGDLTVSMNEEFTMVSIESLRSYNKVNKSLASLAEVDKSGLSVSYMPSSPPHKHQATDISYPDLTAAAQGQDESFAVPTYDPMSWKPTGAASTATLARQEDEQTRQINEIQGWRMEREAASPQRRITHTPQKPPTTVVPKAQPEPQFQPQDEEEENEDIWQEEASRSMEDDALESEQQATHSPKLVDLFADEPLKPRRSKIPKSWRRSSGNDFSYVDSPARQPQKTVRSKPTMQTRPESRKSSAGSTGADSGKSAVLTPPSSEEDLEQDETVEDLDGSDLTEPDAAATQLHNQESFEKSDRITDTKNSTQIVQPARKQAAIGPNDSHVEGDTTGFAWQRPLKRPERPRAPIQKAMDLSDLLNLESSPVKSRKDNEVTLQPSNVQSRALSSGGRDYRSQHSNDQSNEQSYSVSSIDESFESKTPDQRQLLKEVRSSRNSSPLKQMQLTNGPSRAEENSSHIIDEQVGDEDSESQLHFQPSQSYEERLNIESPQKIRVKFNDSEGNSSLLMPKREHSSLFGTKSRLDSIEETLDEDSVVLPKTPVVRKSTLFNWVSSALSSFVPKGPTFITPEPEPSTLCPPGFCMHIRSRYGVVTDCHPWTFSHYRTLHRMLNSCTSGRYDTVIPKPGQAGVALSRRWMNLVGSEQPTFLGKKYKFNEQHALVIVAFFQCVVPAHVVEAMDNGEVDFLGDPSAYSHRGTDRFGNRGSDLPFKHLKHIVVPSPGSPIDAEFVMRVLGDCVLQNEIVDPLVAEAKWKLNPIKLFWNPDENVGADGDENDGERYDESYDEEDDEGVEHESGGKKL
ncbi:Hypothetical protein R9X50_00283900 [Acrodontium crateriforme]|uniref:Uncharacterized protein n=1 Tax=Acrodontium crateriforme TaxID=150365 RepID=A0AAQ3R8X1_9PEZI|nr:Hypothetical protein R9X50_00283900 [Acrodontium crateriforme]